MMTQEPKNFQYVNQTMTMPATLLYYINRAGFSLVNPDFHIERSKAYPYCTLHYLLRGSGSVVVDGLSYAVQKDQIFLISSHTAHTYGTDPQDPMTIVWIEFSGGDSSRICDFIINELGPVIDSSACETVKQDLMGLIQLLKTDPHQPVEHSKLLYSILVTIISAVEASQSQSGQYEWIRSAVQFIEKNLDQPIDMNELAELTGYNPDYFAKLFAKMTGLTPVKYHMKKRIWKAKELLDGSDMSVEAISERLGFCHPSYFIKCFRQLEGVTPAQFRSQSLLYQIRRNQ